MMVVHVNDPAQSLETMEAMPDRHCAQVIAVGQLYSIRQVLALELHLRLGNTDDLALPLPSDQLVQALIHIHC
jgi:hypothetical protein